MFGLSMKSNEVEKNRCENVAFMKINGRLGDFHGIVTT